MATDEEKAALLAQAFTDAAADIDDAIVQIWLWQNHKPEAQETDHLIDDTTALLERLRELIKQLAAGSSE
jgi:hypothetical protein